MKPLEVTLDLDAIFLDENGTTLLDLIVAAAGKVLLDRVEDNAARAANQLVRQVTDEEIRSILRPMLNDAVERAIQPTNTFGESKGAPVTLAERITQIATDELRVAKSHTSSMNRTRTLIEEIIRTEVEQTLRTELKGTIDEAKKQVVTAVREQGAQVLQETIDRMARTS